MERILNANEHTDDVSANTAVTIIYYYTKNGMGMTGSESSDADNIIDYVCSYDTPNNNKRISHQSKRCSYNFQSPLTCEKKQFN